MPEWFHSEGDIWPGALAMQKWRLLSPQNVPIMFCYAIDHSEWPTIASVRIGSPDPVGEES